MTDPARNGTFDPFSDEWAQCPFEHLARARDAGPVQQVGELPMYLVTGHPELVAVLRDHRSFVSSTDGFGDAFRALGLTPTAADIAAIQEAGCPMPSVIFNELVHRDPPMHTRQRRLVNRWFTPKAVETRWMPMITAQVDSLLASFDPAGVELMEAFAIPLPIRAIGSILGIPVDEQRDFKRWSDAFVGTVARDAPAEVWMTKARAAAEMEVFFSSALDARHRHPAGDLLSELVIATNEDPDSVTGDAPLTMAEVLDIVYQLLVAGNETTTQLLGEMALMLVEHPQNWYRMRDDRELIPRAVEEALRWSSPIVGMMHFCVADTDIAGTTIPAGAIVGVMFGGANHDGRVFEDPDAYVLERENAVQHLAFGSGIHTCLGAPLARAEARVAFDRMLDELPGPPRLQPGAQIERASATFSLRGLTSLPLTFDAGG